MNDAEAVVVDVSAAEEVSRPLGIVSNDDDLTLLAVGPGTGGEQGRDDVDGCSPRKERPVASDNARMVLFRDCLRSEEALVPPW
jgi:hypothetical protein